MKNTTNTIEKQAQPAKWERPANWHPDPKAQPAKAAQADPGAAKWRESELQAELERVKGQRDEARQQLDVTTTMHNSALEYKRQLASEKRELLAALKVVLDQVDWVSRNCRVNEMVGAVLDKAVIDKARAAIAKAEKRAQ